MAAANLRFKFAFIFRICVGPGFAVHLGSTRSFEFERFAKHCLGDIVAYESRSISWPNLWLKRAIAR